MKRYRRKLGTPHAKAGTYFSAHLIAVTATISLEVSLHEIAREDETKGAHSGETPVARNRRPLCDLRVTPKIRPVSRRNFF